jgi:hypothetical protein
VNACARLGRRYVDCECIPPSPCGIRAYHTAVYLVQLPIFLRPRSLNGAVIAGRSVETATNTHAMRVAGNLLTEVSLTRHTAASKEAKS